MADSAWNTVDLQWAPNSSPIPVSQLIRPTRDSKSEQEMIAKMWVMCAIEMQDNLRAATCSKPHFERYRALLATEYERFNQPDYPQVPNSRELVAMSSQTRLEAITELRDSVKDTYMWPVIEGPYRVFDNVVDIVEGRVKLVKVLLKDGLLASFYDWANGLSEVEPLFNLMGRTNPRLRILEIGAGTGGTTARALEGLKSESGKVLYSNYVFTDISPLFFDAGKKRFQAYENIEYCALDISKDPLEQGFEAGTYDLIIASNGMLPGWWLGGEDGRADSPCIPPAEWDRRLQQAGFEGLHAVGLDSEPPFYYNANMLARPAVIAP
ncbi:Mycolipanoate synthase [Kalmusia sp. IMI 367209]|nr:Mycolipanoate synthase [Kalmusia sp. IMI 367209]